VGHAIFDTADVNIFLLGNNTLLISSDKYFESFFFRATESYRALRFTYCLSMAIFLNIDISQGSVATRLRRGGIFKRYIIANLLLSLKVKEF